LFLRKLLNEIKPKDKEKKGEEKEEANFGKLKFKSGNEEKKNTS